MSKQPVLRFKGYTKEWESCKVGNFTNVLSASRVHKNEWTNDGVPFFRSSDVVSHFKGNDNEKAFISLDLYSELIKTSGRLQKGDILITGGGSIGIPYIVPNNNPLYSKDADLLWIKASQVHDSEYLFTYFTCPSFRKYIRSISHIGTIAHYTIEQIKVTPVELPEIEEQTEIGICFRNLDQLISFHQCKYEKLLTYKNAMLEKMFPKDGADVPEVRFSGFTGAWEQRKFKDTVLIERGGSPRPIDAFITDAENGLNWIKIGDAPAMGNYITHTAEKIRPEGLSKTREVQPGDLVLSNSMSFGKPYIMSISGCIHDGWLLIRNEKNIFDLTFLCHLLGSEWMLKQYRSLAAGSTVNNLNKELVGSTVVKYPSVEEQKVLGNFFTTLDNLIALQQRRVLRLRKLKTALLDKMFI